MDKAKHQIALGGRRSGKTAAAMQASPKGAVYIWVSHDLRYPKELARKLGREDLEIVGPNWLTDFVWQGRTFSEVVKDHATSFSMKHWYLYDVVKNTRVRP